MKLRDDAETTRDNLLARQAPVELRRCLMCEAWMRSIGPDHRICNPCKPPGTTRLYARAGERLGKTRGL